MRRVFVLINNTGIGGTERRMGRLFARMVMADPDAALIINAGLWRKLAAAGLVTGREERVWRLPEPCGRLAEGLGLRGAPAFWLRKLDYGLFSLLVLARYGPAARRLFHLVLGGAYVAVPLMVVRPDHRTLVSVMSFNDDLECLVGTPLALPLFRAALVLCTRIDALTEDTQMDVIRLGIDGGKMSLPPGSVVDWERFRPADPKEPWVVFACRLIDDKDPQLFVEAIPAIRRDVPAARFFLLGEGPLQSPIHDALVRLRLSDVVETGFHPDIAPILGRARVFLSLQRHDNYPSQSLLEAMACGAVPVATDVGMTWRLVDEATGIRVKRDPGQVAEAVVALLKDPARCERLGQSARQRVLEQHSGEGYRAYLESLYTMVGA